MTESQIIVTVCVEKDGDGFYAYAPALRGLHVGGDTSAEALKNVEDGIILYLRSLIRHGEPFPEGPHLKVESSTVPLTREIVISWESQKSPGGKSKVSPPKKSYGRLREMVGFKKKQEELLSVS